MYGYEQIREIGILSDDEKKTYTKRLNFSKWGKREAGYDIRTFKNENGERTPCKGISLNRDEAFRLMELLQKEFADPQETQPAKIER